MLSVVLYGYGTLFETLREEHRPRFFESRVLRKIFGPQKDWVRRGWRRLDTEKLYVFYVHDSVHLGNIYIYIYIYIYIFDCKSDEMNTDFLCILNYTVLALHVSGAICTHHQEHKLQSRASHSYA
jgi:hypothetical protein